MRAHLKLTAVACAVALTACAGTGERRADDEKDRDHGARPPTPPSSEGLKPPPIPDRGAYLGAWINPTGPERERARASGVGRDQVAAMHAIVGSSLGMLLVYARWNAPAPVQRLEHVTAAGAVPVLGWACGPDGAIVDGHEDDHIRAYAEALKAFGRPLFLRYAWEMNIGGARRARCETAGGPAGFVAAWRRVRDIFLEVGADNVAFVWCPGIGRPGAWRSYFPGADAVDWIGVDGYVRNPDPAAASKGFPRVFASFYAQFAPEGKPIMVAETGAPPAAQAGYLSSLAALLPSEYPQVKALAYFDAPGPRGDWSLSTDGRSAFNTLATDPYFSFRA
jgi:hypothetical protein